jgi:hypothetical protein
MDCKVCGSQKTKKELRRELIRAPHGSEELYNSTTIYCEDCNAKNPTLSSVMVVEGRWTVNVAGVTKLYRYQSRRIVLLKILKN